MSTHALLFEAKSIQEYLFQSGRLKDVVGASELVDSLTGAGGLLEDAVQVLQLQVGEGKDLVFSRRAGGAFYVFSDKAQKLDDLLALWTLLVQQYAPGLAYDLGRGIGATPEDAFDEARKAMRADASRHRPRLPVASPITERSRRTGLAVEDRRDEAMDAATLRKRRMADSHQNGFITRFSPPEAELTWKSWPRTFEIDAAESDGDAVFPFKNDQRTVALIHADGNGLGQLLMNNRKQAANVPGSFILKFQRLSEGIAKCVQSAAQEATRRVLIPARNPNGMLPARPILQGGDDLIILVRADLALGFLQTFVDHFELESRGLMQDLNRGIAASSPHQLTMGVGVVYIGASQPFYLASRLAESLMAAAKRSAKEIDRLNPPSAVVFHRVTNALIDDYEAIVEKERTHVDGSLHYVDTLGAYFLGPLARSPRQQALQEGKEIATQVASGRSLGDLFKLQEMLGAEDMARGPTRQLLTLMGLAPGQARTHYRRWRQLMTDGKWEKLKEFDEILGKLIGGDAAMNDLPYGGTPGARQRCSPIGDVLALMAVQNIVPITIPTTVDKEAAA